MTPETEAKLNELVVRTHRDRDDLLEEAVKRLFAYHERLEQEAQNSLAAAERGKIVPDNGLRAWIEQENEFEPVELSGEPLSETIRRERR